MATVATEYYRKQVTRYATGEYAGFVQIILELCDRLDRAESKNWGTDVETRLKEALLKRFSEFPNAFPEDYATKAWEAIEPILADLQAEVRAAREYAIKQDAPFVALGRCQEKLQKAEADLTATRAENVRLLAERERLREWVACRRGQQVAGQPNIEEQTRTEKALCEFDQQRAPQNSEEQ